MEEKINALMIKSVDYGENDKILTLFSLEKGVVSAKIRGVKKAGAKLKFCAEPFCFSEYVISGKGSTVINASLHDGFYPLRLDIVKFYAGSAAVEFVRKFCPENEVAEKVFIELIKCLKTLAYTDKSPLFTLVVFFDFALKEIGYGMNLYACDTCGGEVTRPFFDFSTGTVKCENCRTANLTEIRISTYKLLAKIDKEGIDVLDGDFTADDDVCRRTLMLITKYIKVNASEELKSLKELLNLYNGN